MVNDLFCTLFEGTHHHGVAALLNSLHHAGLEGTVACGLRGPKPAWTDQLSKLDGLDVHFLPVNGSRHLTHHKPTFMLSSAARFPSARIHYLDPDVVVKAPATVMQRWSADGLALVADVNANFAGGHPKRLMWLDILRAGPWPVLRNLPAYYNAGYVGVPVGFIDFLEAWARCIDMIEREVGELTSINILGADQVFNNPDQDAMNIALSLGTWTLNAVGPENMDFAPGGDLLSHAVGTPKPWEGQIMKRALSGGGLPPAHAAWLSAARGPITSFGANELAHFQRRQTVVRALGRVYSRRGL